MLHQDDAHTVADASLVSLTVAGAAPDWMHTGIVTGFPFQSAGMSRWITLNLPILA
jgi:hypothetical protein